MKTKADKEQIVAELTELLNGANGLYSVDFTGLSVADTIKLRREFKNAGVRYKVAKNTLFRRALAEVGGYDDEILARFKGQTGLAVGYDDPGAPARILNDFKSDHVKLNFAVIEGAVFDGSKLKDLAAMPSRNDVLSGIVGALNAPASGIVGAVNAVMRDLFSVIEEVAKKQGK